MKLQSSALPLESKMQKEISLKLRIKLHQMKESERNASSSSSSWNRCSKCSKSFSSTKALFGHSRIHRKSNSGAGKTTLAPLRQARQAEDVIATSILMRMRNSKSETDIFDAKLSQLRWVCDKIEKQRKKMKEVATNKSGNHQGIASGMLASSMMSLGGPSVGKCNKSISNDEVNAGAVVDMVAPPMLAAVGAAEVAVHRCDKCDKVFNSGQALGGHKRAHYTGSPLCRPRSNGSSQEVVTPSEVVVLDFDLNEPAEEVFL